MSNSLHLSSAVINLADNFDDLLESLSTLQRLGELHAYELTESTLLEQTLDILYQCCKATSCTVYLNSLSAQQPHTATTSLGVILAIDSNNTHHHRAATPIEDLFIRTTMTEKTMQYCNDCTTLDNGYQCISLEMSIISVPLIVKNDLAGVITISYSQREHFNSWGYRLMQTFSTFLGQQLTICRLQQQISSIKS